MKRIYLDLETTGTDPATAAITQLTCIKVDQGVESTLDLRLFPHKGARIDPDALAVTGLTMDDLYDPSVRIQPEEAYREFVRFCDQPKFVKPHDRFFLIGYNVVGFDAPFLVKLGTRCGDRYTWARYHWPPIDVAVLAANNLSRVRAQMPNFKLMTVARALGLEVDDEKAHDALYDVTITKNIFELFINEDDENDEQAL